jgi:nitronate monooxygenase
LELKSLKIGKWEIKYPIFQGGMGVGISWDKLAGSVSATGAMGIISTVGTGYYENKRFSELRLDRPKSEANFYSKDALLEIFKNARKLCGNRPIGANILYAINDYGRVVKDACEAGANAIITGAGLPTNMPEFTKDFPDVALIPIVSSAKALKIICKRWSKRYNKLPDAVIVEGPLSGGHQGFSYDDCFKEENKLENIVPLVKEEAKNWGNIPLIAAGGIWDKKDIEKFIKLGANGVQMATRFIATHECDASDKFKQILIKSKKEDIKLIKSPVGYPARAITTKLMDMLHKKTAPKVKCVSNCVAPCKRGVEATKVGYCIADRLGDAFLGEDDGLFFSGSNGYKVKNLIHVKELIKELTN